MYDVFARAAARGLALDRAQVLALLFHDAVHVAGAEAGVNESLSSLVLRQAAHGRDELPADDVDRACAMIRDTADHTPRSAGSEAVIALDLATLGDTPARFDAWTGLVWLEYRHLFAADPEPERAFLQRRLRVLDALQAATRGMTMPDGWHAAFRANLERLARRHAPR